MLETTFLIDLERERHKNLEGPAHLFLQRRADERLHVAVTTAGELAAGAGDEERQSWEHLLAPFEILGIDLDVCWSYGRAHRYLKTNGFLIGANDLWIAAIAMRNSLELVTRNEQHFHRVPGLEVAEYRQSSD